MQTELDRPPMVTLVGVHISEPIPFCTGRSVNDEHEARQFRALDCSGILEIQLVNFLDIEWATTIES